MKHFRLTEPLTVLIVDEDLGFVWWLGEILHNAGCTVVPALDCQQALNLVRELGVRLDLAFVDPALIAYPSMLEILREGQQSIKVVEVPSLREDYSSSG